MNRVWTSRERVQAALAHREPDRVPIGLTIAHSPYQKLRQYLGFPFEEHIQTFVHDEVRPSAQVAEFLGIDLAFIQLCPLPDCEPAETGLFFDEWRIGRQVISTGLNESKLQTVESPLKDADLENLRDFDWPEYELVRDAGGLGLEARQLYHQTQLALVGRLAGPILTIARDLRGEEKWQQDLVDNPDFACALLNRIAGIQIDLDEAGLRFAGRYLSIVEVNELSLAPQAVRLSAPGIWRHTIRPVLERRWRAARLAMQRYAPQAKLMFSSNFTQPAILEEMIDGGIDLVGPLQPASGDADFSGLKRDYGRRISFYGGVDGAHLLSAANEAEVRKVIETCLKQLGPGGGFILAPSQTVQAGALPQNIVAMCETAKVYGRYSSL